MPKRVVCMHNLDGWNFLNAKIDMHAHKEGRDYNQIIKPAIYICV